MTKNGKTIESTLNSDLCTGCGTCEGICPNSAIQMRKVKGIYVPILDAKMCNHCGICFQVCPGHSIDFRRLNSAIFGTDQEETLMGNYLSCYVGHSTDPEIRRNSSSGGLVTGLLVFALEEGIIDGALVTKMSDASPLDPEVIIAKTRDEIIESSKSKYCPVPANVALKGITGKNMRLATVGLPCHIEGIRKAEALNRQLAEKIVLHLGLFCNHTPTFLATAYLLHKMGMKSEDVKKIDYRGGGWPGRMSVELRNGEKKSVQYSNLYYWGHIFNTHFFTSRCILCNDKICELSDISFGDAWHLLGSRIGKSIIVSRKETGENLLQKASEKGQIEIEEVNASQVLECQGIDLVERRHMARMSVFRKLGKDIPNYNKRISESRPLDYAAALMSYLRMHLSSKSQFWSLLDIYPLLMSRIRGSYDNLH